MITFACASCGKTLKVKDEFTGRISACPQCKKPIVVPLAEATLTEPQAGDTPSSPEGECSDLAFLAPKQRPNELGRLGSYRVLKVLGSGGMGVVLQAEDPALKRLVALKVMRPELAAKETNRQRFVREARATAAVEHAHIVPILHIGQEGQVLYIALPILKGEPLDERLKREPRLPVAEAVCIARQTAEGLEAAHEHGLIHRDIKPANLWLEASPGRKSGEINVKILDFGLARGLADETHLTQSGMIVGTPAYMAPEQARGESVDARCDLYSLGVVLYRMCTGDVPFKAKDTLALLCALALDTPTEPRRINPDIPAALNELIVRLMAKQPSERPASAAEVVDALRAIERDADQTQVLTSSTLRGIEAGGEGERTAEPLTPHLSPLSPGARGARRLLLALAGGLAAILLLGIMIFWPTPQGTVRIESDDPDVQIVFDQNGPTIKGVDKQDIALRTGDHGFVVKRGDLTFETTKFVLKKGETISLKVELLGGKLQIVQDGQVVVARDVPLAKTFKNPLGMEFVLVPKGKFWMGGTGGNVGDKEAEIPYDFYLGKYQVTQEEWEKVTGQNPSHFSRTGNGKDAVKEIADAELKRFPVEKVSWGDCQAFLRVVNEKVKEAGWVYRLPTDAEWEYACRGGPSSNKFDYGFDYYFEKPSLQLLPDQANFKHGDKALNRTCKVGSYQPNKLGLFDMHGNVWEWCDDEMKNDEEASLRVVRGGSWGDDSGRCRAALRGECPPSFRNEPLGLRLARVPVGAQGK
jgi:serine/threonine protein kinase/formylglycine-generating enzyme required for sulfatase activity